MDLMLLGAAATIVSGIVLVALARRDLGLRAAADLAARRTMALCESLLEHSTDAIVVVDRQGTILHWSRRAERLFGWRAAEAVGQPFAEVTHPPEARAAQHGEAEMIMNGGSPGDLMPAEVAILRRDGERIAAEVTRYALRSPLRLLLVYRDASERQTTRVQLYRLTLAAARSAQPLLVLDGAARCAWTSPAPLAALGFAPDDVRGQLFGDVLRLLRMGDTDVRDVQRCLVGHQPLRREVAVRSKTGAAHRLVLDLVPDDRVVAGDAGFVVTLTDVTQLRHAESVLRRLHASGGRGPAVARMAHDFNNVLARIVGSLDLAAANATDPVAVGRYTGVAMKAALAGRELTEALEASAADAPPGAEPVPQSLPLDIGLALGEMLPALRGIAGQGVSVETRLATGAMAAVDRGGFEASIRSLVANAKSAMPDGGQISISVDHRDLVAGSESELGVNRGNYVVVEVVDNGTGMAPRILRKATEPFFTTRPPSAGLGLATADGVARRSGGASRVFSEEGMGTCVQLYFPATAPAVARNVRTATNAFPRGSERLLVVENEPALLDVAARWLRDLGYSVVAAASQEQAAQLLSGGRPFDLLFTDAVMPGALDGLGLVRLARKRNPAQPAVMTSGFSARYEHRPEARGIPWLRKPYCKSELAGIVRRALDGAGPAAEGSRAA